MLSEKLFQKLLLEATFTVNLNLIIEGFGK